MTKYILYQAPSVDFIEVEQEGVLCQSGQAASSASVKPWTQSSNSVDF